MSPSKTKTQPKDSSSKSTHKKKKSKQPNAKKSVSIDDSRFQHASTDPRFSRMPQHYQPTKTKILEDERFAPKILSDIIPKDASKVDAFGKPLKSDSLSRLYELDFDLPSQPTSKTKTSSHITSQYEREIELQVPSYEDSDMDTSAWEDVILDLIDEEINKRTLPPSEFMDGEDEDDSTPFIEVPNLDTGEDMEVTHRIAINRLHWSSISAEDLYVLLSSFLPPGGKLLKVSVYLSNFGKKRISKEQMGPDKELWSEYGATTTDRSGETFRSTVKRMFPSISAVIDQGDTNANISGSKTTVALDADTLDSLVAGKVLNQERVKTLEEATLFYYYAIATFDSKETAKSIFIQLDSMEFELSTVYLSMQFVPDEVSFEEEDLDPEILRDSCTQETVSPDYKAPRKFFLTSSTTNPTLKWDPEDPKRYQLKQRFDSDDAVPESKPYEQFIAPSDDSLSEIDPLSLKSLLGLDTNSSANDSSRQDLHISFSSSLTKGLGSTSHQRHNINHNERNIKPKDNQNASADDNKHIKFGHISDSDPDQNTNSDDDDMFFDIAEPAKPVKKSKPEKKRVNITFDSSSDQESDSDSDSGSKVENLELDSRFATKLAVDPSFRINPQDSSFKETKFTQKVMDVGSLAREKLLAKNIQDAKRTLEIVRRKRNRE